MTTGLTALPETLAALDGAEVALFDYDGTLVDSVPLLWDVYADLARVLGGTPCASDFEGDFEGTPIPTLMQRLAGRLESRRPVSELTALHGRMARARCARQGPRPAAGAGELLAKLRRRGRVLALVTSAERRWVAAPLELSRVDLDV